MCGEKRSVYSVYSVVKTAALLLLFAAPTANASDGWFTPHAYYSCDVLSAYISRGKVYENRPIWSNEIDFNLGLSDFGRIGFNHWDYSCLTGAYQDKYRRFMPETDWAVYYEYDLKFNDDWKLTTQLMTMWKTYYGGKPESDPTDRDWRLKQTLKNPYITPYYKIHFNERPYTWWYYQIGLKRAFKLFQGLSLTPNVAMDFADGAGRNKRFGSRKIGGTYGSGVVSMIAELTAEYAFTEWFSVHATVGQFCIMDSAGRDNLSACYKRDITYGQVGVKFEF